MRIARAAWKGTHPKAFLPRHRGRLPHASREIANCLQTALHGIRVQAEELAAAGGELDQIEARGPALVMPPSGVVDVAAIVPDPVHRPSLSLKMLTGGRILDPASVGQHHEDRVVGAWEINNPDAEFSS